MHELLLSSEVENLGTGKWYDCNDSWVKQVTGPDTDSASAYVLFYVQVSELWIEQENVIEEQKLELRGGGEGTTDTSQQLLPPPYNYRPWGRVLAALNFQIDTFSYLHFKN